MRFGNPWFSRLEANSFLMVQNSFRFLTVVLMVDSSVFPTEGSSKVYGCALPLAGSEDSEVGVTDVLSRMLRRGCRAVALIPMLLLPPTLSATQEDDDDEFAPENVTFAPKDVTPLDFNPKLGVQGLGYRGLDPGLALHGRGAREHINLFDPQSDARSQLFGGADGNRRRRGVAGQVAFLRPASSLRVGRGLSQQELTFGL